ncbi:MAG: outer membrane beta-barrel protein [Bacteroidetes bacterium]|nr:outer membrane beta-barrel protein [Bacteroidota bacterium]MCB0845611.1 outer membrane beta-barrel protein [Bacteroidota bacterium]MCB0854386.1 outer membrane beta-barrel protein [Bacteroidota bacterium]
MKERILFILSLLVLCWPTEQTVAQNHSSGDFLISAGVATGGYRRYGNYTNFSIPAVISAEYGINDELSAGPFITYSRFKYGGIVSYAYAWHVIDVGGRVSYRFIPLLEQILEQDINIPKLDVYASFMIGYENVVYSSKEGPKPAGATTLKNRVRLGPALGARYYLRDNIALFLETGVTNFGSIHAGASFKL